MTWSSDDNPWAHSRGSNRNSQRPEAPPSFDEVFERLKRHWRRPPQKLPPQKTIFLLLGGLFLIWLASGFYTVKEAEQAVVLRFGAYVETVGAGLRYHLPYPFETVAKRNVAANNYLSSEERNTISADISALTLDEKEHLAQRTRDDFYMLTGDENLVELDKYTILWRIRDLRKFLFNIRMPRAVILAAADSALREIIAKTPINLIITERRAQVNEEVTKLLQELLDQYDSGIHIVEFLMQKADPPEPVLDAFLDVTRAEADRERAQHEARGYRDEILPKARAVARKSVLEAEGYAREIVARSEGDAGRFLALYQEYAKAPAVTRKRLYTETMEEVLRRANKVIMDGNANSVLPHLPLTALQPSSPQPSSQKKGEEKGTGS